jgi:hypothetical protein
MDFSHPSTEDCDRALAAGYQIYFGQLFVPEAVIVPRRNSRAGHQSARLRHALRVAV